MAIFTFIELCNDFNGECRTVYVRGEATAHSTRHMSRFMTDGRELFINAMYVAEGKTVGEAAKTVSEYVYVYRNRRYS